jgi:hypothetical protein
MTLWFLQEQHGVTSQKMQFFNVTFKFDEALVSQPKVATTGKKLCSCVPPDGAWCLPPAQNTKNTYMEEWLMFHDTVVIIPAATRSHINVCAVLCAGSGHARG